MEKLILIHKRRLLSTAVICLFSVLIFSSGRIFINFLDMKSKDSAEKSTWISISKNIESEFPLDEQREWSDYARTNPELFLKANTTKFLSTGNVQRIAQKNKAINSFENILANIVITARKHIRRVAQ